MIKLKDILFEGKLTEASAYKTATRNELAMYITQLSNTIKGTKDRKMLQFLKRTKKEVSDELKSRKKKDEGKLSEAPTYQERQLKVISDGIDTIEGVISPLIRNLVVVDEHAVPQKVEMIKNLKNLQKYFKKLSKQRRSW